MNNAQQIAKPQLQVEKQKRTNSETIDNVNSNINDKKHSESEKLKTTNMSVLNKITSTNNETDPPENKIPNKSIQLTLRFYNLQDKSKNLLVKHPKNVIFKVKMNTKIASIIKKVGEMNNLNADDLHFYQSLLPKDNKFLIATKTVAEENLKENDVILIKRTMLINIRFISHNNFKRAKFDQNFSIVNDSIRLKVEENENINSIFRLLMVNLKIGSENKKESDISNFNFYHVIFQPAKISVNQITDINMGLFGMNIVSNSVVFVECSDEFFNTFIEKSGVNSGKLIADLKVKLQVLEEQTDIDMKLQKENEELKNLLQSKTIKINSLHSEKKHLNAELTLRSNELKELESLRADDFGKLTKVAAAFDDLDKQYMKVTNDNGELLSKMESLRLLHGKQLNSVNIEKEKIERKLTETENSFRRYAVHLFNEQSEYLSTLNEKLDLIIHSTNFDFDRFAKNRYLSDEINLDPIDFDYLTLIINESNVNTDFVQLAKKSKSQNPKVHSDIIRPKPEFNKLDNNQTLFEIFTALYENDEHLKGLSVKEISQITKRPVQDISNIIQDYLQAIEVKSSKVYYNISKRWDTTKKLSTYKYSKLVPWVRENNDRDNNEKSEKNNEDSTHIMRNIKKAEFSDANKLYNLNEINSINAIKDLEYDNLLVSKCNKIGDIMTKINSEILNSFDNVSKNLVNVLEALKSSCLRENNFIAEKENLIEKFRLELYKANEKVRFVQTYDKRLKVLQSEIDELRSDKINFENDNSIYEKFLTDSSPCNDRKRIAGVPFEKSDQNNEQPLEKKRKILVNNRNVENRLMVVNPSNNESSYTNEGNLNNQLVKINTTVDNETLNERESIKLGNVEYVDIQIVLHYDPRVDPLFLRAKKQAKLKKILKSYKKKLHNGLPGGNFLSDEEVNSIVLTLNGSIDINYNLSLEELNICNHQIVNAIIPK